MHFTREVNQNPPGTCDPRLRHYFVYQCSVCKHEKDYNWVPNFNTTELRKCPNCGVTDDSNDKEYLIRQQQKLEQEISALKQQLEIKQDNLADILAKLHEIKHTGSLIIS